MDASGVTPLREASIPSVSDRREFANVVEKGSAQDDDEADSASATDNGQGKLVLDEIKDRTVEFVTPRPQPGRPIPRSLFALSWKTSNGATTAFASTCGKFEHGSGASFAFYTPVGF